MTVSYNTKVTDAGLITFVRLFFRWKGSVWKAVWKELILWLTLYFALNLTYRYAMDDEYRSHFEDICKFFHSYNDFIPLTFMLGFFVNLVVNRWWTMWENIGWIDPVSLFINGHIPGNDEMSRMYRRNIIRYLLFFQVLVFRDISTPIRKRFPALETFVVAGYITEQELEDYQSTPTTYKNYYTPIRWAMNLVRQARASSRISNDYAVVDLFRRIIEFRSKMGVLLTYDFQPIPLIYTVVVCLSVRLYFIAALLSRQIIDKNEVDTFVPIMTIVQFMFYMGWMKVAEALLNPFGDDDDDFECNWLLDRNFEVGFIIADQNNDRALVKDKHWNNRNPEPVYSIDTVNTEVHPLIGSAARRSSVQNQTKNSAALQQNSDVIMIARTPQNSNEDAVSVSGFDDGRCRRPSSIFASDSALSGTRRRLSRLISNNTPTVTPFSKSASETTDPEVGPIRPPNDADIHKTHPDSISEELRRMTPSIIREESEEKCDKSDENKTPTADAGHVNEALDFVDENTSMTSRP